MAELPSGTVTFLFTDIEGSTQLERQLRERYGEVLGQHRSIVRAAFAAHGGHEIDTQGDSFFYVFPRAKAAVDAAVEAQRALSAHEWPEDGDVRVRMGLNTGEASLEDGRYVGFAVHRAARISAAGHGGQILLSSSTRDVVEHDLDAGMAIRDLGERRFKDLPRPERVYQLVAEGLPSEFGQLQTLDVELRRKRHRLYAGGALIGVLAAAVAIPVFALGQGSGGGTTVAPDSVAIIDPKSNDVMGSVPVGVDPEAITVGAGSVWIANTADQTVSRVDTHTRRVVRTIPVGEYPSDMAVAAGSAWVALGSVPEVRRIAVERNEADEVIAAIPGQVFGNTCGRPSSWLAAGGGALWFACNNGQDTSDASRIDLRAAVPTRIDEALVSSSPAAVLFSDVAFGLGSAWITDRGTNGVTQIAAPSQHKVRQVTVGRAPQAVAVGFGSVWVANGVDDTVSRVDVGDPVEPVAVATIPVGDGPVDVAAGESAVWVVNRGDRSVSRIDPNTGTVVATIKFENEPVRVAAGDGAVWVTVQEGEAS
jgi:YVTN family beta-propeller protein